MSSVELSMSGKCVGSTRTLKSSCAVSPDVVALTIEVSLLPGKNKERVVTLISALFNSSQ